MYLPIDNLCHKSEIDSLTAKVTYCLESVRLTFLQMFGDEYAEHIIQNNIEIYLVIQPSGDVFDIRCEAIDGKQLTEEAREEFNSLIKKLQEEHQYAAPGKYREQFLKLIKQTKETN